MTMKINDFFGKIAALNQDGDEDKCELYHYA